jgi:hypothetical protein
MRSGDVVASLKLDGALSKSSRAELELVGLRKMRRSVRLELYGRAGQPEQREHLGTLYTYGESPGPGQAATLERAHFEITEALSRLGWPREIDVTLEVYGHDGLERRDEDVVLEAVRLTVV